MPAPISDMSGGHYVSRILIIERMRSRNVIAMPEAEKTMNAAFSSRRRWSIRNQLLVPIILLVVGTSAAATFLSVVWIARGVRQQYDASTTRMVDTLTQSSFPLTKNVLDQMRGLSGVSFALVDPEGRILETSIDSAMPPELIALLNPKVPVEGSRLLALRGEQFRVTELKRSGRGTHDDGSTLFLIRPEGQITQQIYDAVYPALLTGGVATVIAILIASWLSRRFVDPITGIVEHASSIASGDFSRQLDESREDEFGDLIRSMNAMSTQLKGYAGRLRESARLSTLNQVGAALAHQLRNSAAGGRMAVELHQRICKQKDDEAIAVALRQFKLMESYLRQFLSMGGESPQNPSEVVALTVLIEAAVSLLKPMADHAGVELTFEPEESLRIIGHDESLRQLVSNLVINGIEAATVGSVRRKYVRIELKRTSSTRGRISFTDSGDGPEPDFAKRMFEPLATNKPDGIGLGLFVAKQIAENHRGSLTYDRLNGMTCFVFEFPLESS